MDKTYSSIFFQNFNAFLMFSKLIKHKIPISAIAFAGLEDDFI